MIAVKPTEDGTLKLLSEVEESSPPEASSSVMPCETDEDALNGTAAGASASFVTGPGPCLSMRMTRAHDVT